MLFLMYKHQLAFPHLSCYLSAAIVHVDVLVTDWFICKIKDTCYAFQKKDMMDMFNACNIKKRGIGYLHHVKTNDYILNNNSHIVGYYKITYQDKNTHVNEYGFVRNHMFNKWKNRISNEPMQKRHGDIIYSLRNCICNHENPQIDNSSIRDMIRLVKDTILEPFFYMCEDNKLQYRQYKYNIECASIRIFYDEEKLPFKKSFIIVILEYIEDCIVLHVNAAKAMKCSDWYRKHAFHICDQKTCMENKNKNIHSNWTKSCLKLIQKMDRAFLSI